jgi:hypothetical protein
LISLASRFSYVMAVTNGPGGIEIYEYPIRVPAEGNLLTTKRA